MKRRQVLKTGLAASLAGAASAGATVAADSPHYYELRTYETRNDLKPARLQDFIRDHFMPALKRAGAGPVGCFVSSVGFIRPGLLVVIDHKSMGDLQTTHEQLAADKEYGRAVRELEAGAELPYVRYETSLLRAFDGHAKAEVPAPLTDKDGKPQLRLFELRTYESRTTYSLRNKVDMFNQEEIKIFRDCGFAPVCFGETIAGPRMPSLTYLVGFDNLDAREKAWAKFIASPDFNRIKVKPGWTDPEAVSNIHADYLRPLPFSQIR
ncbi:MAG: NIPSNAP family protein [Blastocatellia bacterium]